MHGCFPLFYLTEEVPLTLPFEETREVAADHQVRVIQDCVEPAPGGQECLDTQDNRFTATHCTLLAENIIFGFKVTGTTKYDREKILL